MGGQVQFQRLVRRIERYKQEERGAADRALFYFLNEQQNSTERKPACDVF